MQLKTILNRVQKFKSFVYGPAQWVNEAGQPAVEVEWHARAHSRAICSGCARRWPGYDRLGPRRFEFIPLWGLKVFFLCAPRRVDCPCCGVKVERMPLRLRAGQALGQRQALVNPEHCLVSSRLGQAVKLERGSLCISHHLGSGIQFGRDGGELGA